MTSEKKIQANQQNAQKSTGPKTDLGKQVVSKNRISHGILSNRLLLDSENPDEFRALLDDLQIQLKPVGSLELSLVEKIAITLWRQQRLIKAETASIALGRNDERVTRVTESGMGLSGMGSERLKEENFNPPDQEQIDWCRSVLQESEKMSSITLNTLKKKAPLIQKQLADEAKADEQSITEYLQETSLEDYIVDLVIWCRETLDELEQQAKRFPIILATAEKAKDKLCLPWRNLDTLNKYQVTLDNQLFKTIKALRETQEWRHQSLEVIPIESSTEEQVSMTEAVVVGLNGNIQSR